MYMNIMLGSEHSAQQRVASDNQSGCTFHIAAGVLPSFEDATPISAVADSLAASGGGAPA